MSDQDKAKQQLIEELAELRRRVATLEGIDRERRRAEEELRRSEGRYRALAESTRDIIYILDRQGTLLYANQAASQCLGIPSHEIVGKRQTELFPPDMAQAHAEKIGRIFATGDVLEEDELFHFGPEEVWLRIHLLPLRDEAGQVISVMGVCHNITDRKRAEEALQEAHDELERRVGERTAELTKVNEELAIFQKFAEAAGQGFSMADLDGHLIYLNPTLCRMLGEERPEDRIGQHLSIYYSEQSNRRGKQEIEPALKQRGYWEGELPMLSRQGKSVPTWHNTFIIRDESGNPLRMAVVVTDITERKQAEEALRKSERRFRNYFDQGLIGMAVTSLDKRWLEVNDRLCEILGYSREELCQKTWAELTHPDDLEPNLQLFNPLLAGEIERFTLNKRYVKKDGNIVHATIHSRAFRKDDGTMDHIVTLIEDITARKQAEEALRISEEKYRGVAEACPDAIVMSDLKGRLLFASRQTWRLLGLADSDELVGKSVFDYVIENDQKRLAANMFNVVEVGVRSGTEYTSLRQDGTTVPAEASSVLIRDATGQPKAVMAVIRDITERKRAEEALRASMERYELAVRGAGVGIWDWDIRTGKLYYSPRWKMLFGYDENDIGESLEDWTRLLHPDERDWILKFQDDFLAGTSPTVTVEYRLRHKDGSYRWIVAHALVV
jgi:PAS domain S-box-containing protein